MSTTASSTLYAPGARAVSGVWLHWFAIIVAVCTFCLLLAGSVVTTTGSGLAVPDWPTTYGENMFTFPPSKWVGGIWYEHVHRLIGSDADVLTETELDMGIRVSGDVELLRVGAEDLLVAVGSAVEQDDLLPLEDRLPADLDVLRGRADHVRHRVGPAQHFLHGTGN